MDIVGKKPQYIVHYNEYNNTETLRDFKEDAKLTKLTAYLSAEYRSTIIKDNMAALRAEDKHVEDTKLLEISQKQFETLETKLNKVNNIDV